MRKLSILKNYSILDRWTLNMFDLPSDLRAASRRGSFCGQTAGQAPGFAQANLCILPKEYAFDFLLFCQRNSKPCPLIHVLEPGVFNLDDIDVRTDCPKYRLFKDGELDAMIQAGLKIRHIEEGKNVPMYKTNIPCKSAGIFHGNMVVSMRPFTPKNAIKAVEISGRYPRVHGAPIHLSEPHSIGILDINKPDFGDSVTIGPGEIPVFWACGVTPQVAVMNSKPSICITHAPGHMLVLNDRNEDL